MDDDLRKELLGLRVGESVTVMIESNQYVGNIIKIEREKCDIVSGFMEQGYIKVYLNLNPQNMDQQNLSEEYLILVATEDAPNDFESPTTSTYSMDKEESTTNLGEVSNIR